VSDLDRTVRNQTKSQDTLGSLSYKEESAGTSYTLCRRLENGPPEC